jgi:hypothetical protein
VTVSRVWPLPDHLGVDLIVGIFAGLLIFVVAVAPFGPPIVLLVPIIVGLIAAITLLSFLVTSIRFDTDHVVITRLWRTRQRIPWTRIAEITSVSQDHNDSDDVAIWRCAALMVYRNPDVPPEPTPTKPGELRRWQRQTYRTVLLPVHLPDRSAPRPRGPLGRLTARSRELVLAELTAHGLTAPE